MPRRWLSWKQLYRAVWVDDEGSGDPWGRVGSRAVGRTSPVLRVCGRCSWARECRPPSKCRPRVASNHSAPCALLYIRGVKSVSAERTREAVVTVFWTLWTSVLAWSLAGEQKTWLWLAAELPNATEKTPNVLGPLLFLDPPWRHRAETRPRQVRRGRRSRKAGFSCKRPPGIEASFFGTGPIDLGLTRGKLCGFGILINGPYECAVGL